jgi:tetratricopeptide (TPR) repeat protein
VVVAESTQPEALVPTLATLSYGAGLHRARLYLDLGPLLRHKWQIGEDDQARPRVVLAKARWHLERLIGELQDPKHRRVALVSYNIDPKLPDQLRPSLRGRHAWLAEQTGSDFVSTATANRYMRRVILPYLADQVAAMAPLAAPTEITAPIEAEYRALHVAVEPAPTNAPSLPTVPRDLAPPPAAFVGRAAMLAQLDAWARTREDNPRTVAITAVSGTPGVGKTALARYWGHRVQDAFPDGTLEVDLRGYSAEPPMETADALALLLRRLNVPAGKISPSLDERSSLYRTELANRRMLIVLDNARDSQHVGPLMPGSGKSFVLITSRDSLAGLRADLGAYWLPLDILDDRDAFDLLRLLIGSRVDREPGATRRLVTLCGRLPLALHLSAGVATATPRGSLRRLVKDLAAEVSRLDVLDTGGEPERALRAVFSWSYKQLDEEVARAFRLLALAPGTDLELHAFAALLDRSVAKARMLAATLQRSSLVNQAEYGRFSMHDLLRDYGRELGAQQDEEGERDDALRRLFHAYSVESAAAMNQLFPHERRRRPAQTHDIEVGDLVQDRETAQAWLDAERANLVSAAQVATATAPAYAVRLSDTVWRYFESGAYFSEGVLLHQAALDAARLDGDSAAEGRALNALACVDLRQGRFQDALARLKRAGEAARRGDDTATQAAILNNMGSVRARLGEPENAIECYTQALLLFERIGDHIGRGHTLNNVGFYYERLGDYEAAQQYIESALELFRTAQDRVDESIALGNLGMILFHLEHYDEAINRLRAALAITRQTHDKAGEADSLRDLGRVFMTLGRKEAIGYLQRSARLSREIGDTGLELAVWTQLAEAYTARDRREDALRAYRRCVKIALSRGDDAAAARAREEATALAEALDAHPEP